MNKQLPKSRSLALWFVSAVLLVLCGRLQVVSSQWSYVQKNMGGVIDAATNPLRDALSPFARLQSLTLTQRQLMETEQKVREKDAQLQALKMVEQENIDLKASLASISGTRNTWVAAQILGGDTQQFVSVGVDARVSAGATIVYKGMFVGTVTNTASHVASIATVRTPGARFGVRLLPGGVEGIYSVGVMGDAKVSTLSRTSEAHVGDKVVTLGDEKGALPGILIGTVEKDLTHVQDSISTFKVTPALPAVDGISVLVHVGAP